MDGRGIRRRAAVGLVVQTTVVVALVFATAAPAFAAKPSHGGGGGGGGGGSGLTTTGYDLSYPQCGSSFPSATAFGIVGVNGGLANDFNPCLGPSSSYTQSELYWAIATSTGGTSQPKASLYVNTADPGNVYSGTLIADWPMSGGGGGYGTCNTTTVTINSVTYTVGENSQACAWQYGYNKATQDVAWLKSAADAINAQLHSTTVADTPSSYPWWLDVETANSWQTDQSVNVADLQGMIAALQGAGVKTIGVYSTVSQWDQITGPTTSLSGMPEWLPGARTLSGAKSNCTQTSFTGGTITVTQWASHPDSDYVC